MSSSELSSVFIGKVENTFNCQDATQVVRFMLECGIIEEKHVLRYVIKDEYYRRLKSGVSCYSIKMDLAVEFDIPFSTVKNIIYRYDHIKI